MAMIELALAIVQVIPLVKNIYYVDAGARLIQLLHSPIETAFAIANTSFSANASVSAKTSGISNTSANTATVAGVLLV